MFYLVVILCGMLTISVFNARYTSDSFLYTLLTPIILTISVVIIDGIVALIIRRLPQKYFDESHKGFDASKNERSFYERIGIKLWKDYVLELGGFTDFHKNKVSKPDCPLYLKRFILECNYGSMIHLVSAFVGFLIVFITPLSSWYQYALPVAVVNAILNLLPMFILRYNVPRLKKALVFAIRKEKMNK